MTDLDALVDQLWSAGFVAAEEEAAELIACADGDPAVLASLAARRLTGEPFAWVVGTTEFCGARIRVDPGVYVPRAQSELVAERAVARLGAADPGVAVDLCTGAGAIAATLQRSRPGARVVASDIDAASVACAVANGVDARVGDLFEPVPDELREAVDVVVAVVPYVPSAALDLLARDTLRFESTRSYDGGTDGADLLRRVVEASTAWLRQGGALVLELGGDQAVALAPVLAATGFVDVAIHADEDGDVRAVEATYTGARPSTRAAIVR